MNERFTIEERIRWSDVDNAGIIYYGQFLRFFEIAEMELFRSIGLTYVQVFDKFDIWLPRVHIHFNFRRPVALDDLIEVAAWVGRLGESSFTLSFEVTRKGEPGVVAEGHIVLACVSRATFTSMPVPEDLRRRLSRYLSDRPWADSP